jgi:hypothetical protein
MALNFWETQDVEFKYDTGLPLPSRDKVVEQILNPPTPTFNAFAIGTDERDVSLGDTISAQLGYSYAPLEDAITNYFRFDESDRDQDYNPFADMEGFEDMSDYLKDAVNAEHMSVLKKQLVANEKRRKTLAYSSIGSQLVAGIFDPINLVAIPFGGFTLSAVKAAYRTGRGVALITAGQEVFRYPLDPLGTGKEVAANIGMSFVGGAVLGGLVGGVVSKRISKTLDELEADAKFFDDLAESPERTGPTVADQDVKAKPKKQKIRTEKDLDKKDAQEFLKDADENTIRGFERNLPNKILKIEEEIANKQADSRARDLSNLKPLYESRQRLEKQLQKDAGQSKVLVDQNNRLLNSIENTAKFINDVKAAAAKFAEPLKRIKDDLLAQARGERRNVGLSPKQVALLENIKAKEAQQFFTAKQKASINKSLKTIKEIQSKIDRNIGMLQSKRQGNIKFLGDAKRQQIRNEIAKLSDIISHNNSIIAMMKDRRDVKARYDKINAELNRREVNEFATLDADGKRVDGFKLPPNLYTDNFIYKTLVTPIKKAFQSKILPEISKYKFFKLGADLGMDLVANKLGKTFGQSVWTKSAVKHGEYAQAHDQLRGLYSEHTGKNQVYMDYDFQKKGYHEWLEDTYKRILKDEPLTELDKKVKTVVDKFMERWEKRLRDVGIIGDIANLEKSIIKKSERIIQYTTKLKDVTARGANSEQFQIARSLEQDAINLLTGSRKQETYIPIRKLTGQQLIERFFTDAKISRFVTDREEATKLISQMKDAEGNPLSIDRVLGVHAMYLGRDQGLVVINEKGIRNSYNKFVEAKADPPRFERYINQTTSQTIEVVRRNAQGQIVETRLRQKLLKETVAGMHLDFAHKNRMHINSYDDFYDFIVYHELSHGKFPPKKGESVFDMEVRINEEALKRLLQEKDSFNPATQGMVLTRKNIETDLVSLSKLANEGALTKGQKAYRNRVIQDIRNANDELIELRKTLKDAKEFQTIPENAEKFFPRYFDKAKIKENRPAFEAILTEWYNNNPTILVKSKDGTVERIPPQTIAETVRATDPKNIAKRVKDTVDNILGKGRDVTDDMMAFYGHGKSKHLRHRNLDIPNKLVADFIVTNPAQVMRVYTQRVAPKYEFAKAYNNRTVDEVVADMTADNYAAGMSEKQVNEINRDFLHLYDRVVGNVLKNPDRWDQKVVTGLRDLAQLNYLGSSGFSTIPDFAKILMEHDIGNVTKGLIGVLQDSRVRMTAKEGRLAGEILEILQGDVHMRLVEDLTNNPLAQGYQLKLSKARNVFYMLNGLAPMTNLMKKLDATIRQHELIQFSIKETKGTATKNDIVYLRRYGFNKQKTATISRLYDDGVIQNTKDNGSGLYLANTEKWLQNGATDETLDTFRGALNNGIMNTILMATPADKPIIADGIVYIPKWIGEKFGLKEDVRFKGYTRIETGLAGLPFQFWSYSFAAANKITAALATGQAKNRTAAVTTAIGLGWLSLQIKSEFTTTAGEAMWDNMAWEDQLARAIDSSGILAMYSDLLYTSMNTSMALGGPDISMGLLQPKFPQEKDIGDAITSIGGAGPSIGLELSRGMYEFTTGEYGRGSKQIIKNLPYMRLWFIKDMVNELGNTLVDIDDDGLEKTLRARY